MSTEMIWSVLGVSVSAIFGVVGVYLTIRSRYPGKITFINEQTIELFDAIGNSINDLTVTYGGQQVNENLVLLNGAFINSGKTDITQSMVEQPITLKLPDGYKWLTGSVVKSNVVAELRKIDDETISISTGLFRCGEYVKFHALAQLPDNADGDSNSQKFKKSIKFEHRITNTRNINETEVQSISSSKKNLKRRGLPFLLLFIMVAGMAVSIIYKGIPKTMVYPYLVSENLTEKVRVKTTSEETVEISSIESEFETEEKFTDFVTKINGSPSLDRSTGYISFFIMIGFQLLFVGGMLGFIVFDYTRNRRLLRIINEL